MTTINTTVDLGPGTFEATLTIKGTQERVEAYIQKLPKPEKPKAQRREHKPCEGCGG